MGSPRYNPEDIESERGGLLNRNLIAHRGFEPRYESELSKGEVDSIFNYLENPARTGIWTLKGEWDTFGGISKLFIEKLEEEFKKDYIEIQEGKRKIRIKTNKDLLNNLKQNTRRFTFLFNYFTNLVHNEKQDTSFLDDLRNEEDKLTFDIVDIDEIKAKYSDAYTYFKDNIYFNGFNPSVNTDLIVKIKDGFFILTKSLSDDQEYNYLIRRGLDPELVLRKLSRGIKISLISINREPLEKLKIFYEKLHKISEVSLIPIFSPEEEVFAPYFTFLEKTYYNLIDNNSIKSHFKKSISEYNDKDHSHCIGTIGLILEDYLIQLYETFFRDICPKGLTIGELFTLIQSKTNSFFKSSAEPPPEIKPLYDSVNAISKLTEKDNFSAEVIKILREILTFIKKDKHSTLNMINISQTKDSTKSVFPAQIIDNIKEAIKNRNSISHKSTVPIGNYEALRTVYCCITLLIWWNNEKKLIDWNDNKEDIIKKSIERNSHISLIL